MDCAGLDLILKKVPGARKEDLEDCINKFNDKNRYEREDFHTKAVYMYIVYSIIIYIGYMCSLKCGCETVKLSIAVALVLAFSLIWGSQVKYFVSMLHTTKLVSMILYFRTEENYRQLG